MPRTTCRKGHTRKGYSYEVMGHILKHEMLQVGGSIIKGDDHSYDYRTEQNYNGSIIFRGGRKQGKPECFLLLLNRDKTATLQSLKQAADCSLDPNSTGKSMVNAVVALARQRGAVSINLMDDSKKRLANGKMFRLSNMYFLTMGQTWYESIIPGLHPQEKEALIAQWRQRVMTNTWANVAQRLGRTVIPPVDISDIDVTQPGSAMAVLRRIKEYGSDYFADNEDDLLMASSVGNMYGMAWSAPL